MTILPDDQHVSSARATDGVRFRVEGRVQGVGFRWWARQIARDLQLVGSVRNCDDGSVELLAAGPEHSIERLRSALHSGPAAATVTRVSETPIAGIEAASFEIKH